MLLRAFAVNLRRVTRRHPCRPSGRTGRSRWVCNAACLHVCLRDPPAWRRRSQRMADPADCTRVVRRRAAFSGTPASTIAATRTRPASTGPSAMGSPTPRLYLAQRPRVRGGVPRLRGGGSDPGAGRLRMGARERARRHLPLRRRGAGLRGGLRGLRQPGLRSEGGTSGARRATNRYRGRGRPAKLPR